MKNKEYMIAWLNGEDVEYFSKLSGRWNSLLPCDEATIAPPFSDGLKYRIKPKVEYKYKYTNVYPEAPWVVGKAHNSLEEANMKTNSQYLRTHVLKVGNDNTVELVPALK